MGATNQTTYYNLSQFVATDKPAWLQDYNGDMAKIDAGIKSALTAAQSAQSTADSGASDITQLASDVSSLQTTVAGHTSDIGDLGGDVNTIEALIGNGTPTTTDQTIIGAINELVGSKANLIVGRNKDGTITPSGTNAVSFTISDNLTGYTPIAAFVVATSGGDNICINQSNLSLGDGACTVGGYIKPVSTVISVGIRLISIWVKNN